jgi:sugar lactone lactonase YvrE
VLLEKLAFPDCPRWHQGLLYFSDVHDGRVWCSTEQSQVQFVAELPGRPAGLGWLPDGHLQLVSMRDRAVLRLTQTGLVQVADLSGSFEHAANNMVVDGRGRAYVSSLGFDLDGGGSPAPTRMACVEPDGETWVVIEDLLFPNGSAITPDGRTLLVAETWGRRISAYDIEPDGSLANPRLWSDLQPNVPAGICLDAQGAVWAADPVNNGVMRVIEGAGAVEWIPFEGRGVHACALGGSDGRTLFLCTSPTSNPSRTIEQREGRIEMLRVEVPAAGTV